MKIDLRKFRFWYISYLINKTTYTRKTANRHYLLMKNNTLILQDWLEIYKEKEEKKLLDLAQKLRTLR